jgi:hypothetical protein
MAKITNVKTRSVRYVIQNNFKIKRRIMQKFFIIRMGEKLQTAFSNLECI